MSMYGFCFFFSSRRRHTRCALVTGVQTCALPISGHRCHLVTARDAAGALTGILPLHHIRSPLFGQALVGSGFAVGGGILADDPIVAATLAHGAAAMAKSPGVPSVELRGGAQPEGEGWTRGEGGYAGFARSEEHTSELQSLMRSSSAVFC